MSGLVSELKIGDRIGNGHFGEVFNGVDPAHGEVAVKILRREALHDDARWPTFKARYIAEARMLATASHQNVVQVHHVVEAADGDSVCICMALCPGGSLEAAFKHGPMSLLDVRSVGTGILHGLGVMHGRGLIHRDIKPANLLLDARGEVQISDFGLVTDELVLGYASQVGYWDHLAYEVWQGKGTSVKSDIWALGMTLYRLLHGKTWYDAMPSPRDIIPEGGFADTLKWLPHVPARWRRVLRKMLNDKTADRYQNAAQVLSGFAGLPVTPVWQISVDDDLVRWERTKQGRRIVVDWKRQSTRRHEWVAVSEPVNTGRRRQLAASDGTVGGLQAERGLKEFFGS